MPAHVEATLDPNALVTEHLSMARQIAARLKRRYVWVNMDDLYSYSLLGLTMSANAYDPSRGVPFPNFASRKAMFWAIDEMRKDGILRRSSAKPIPRTTSLSDHSKDRDAGEIDVPDAAAEVEQYMLESRDYCATLLGKLRDRDRGLLMMYYADHMTFREIARVMNISESSVCLRHKALLDKLRKLARSSRISG